MQVLDSSNSEAISEVFVLCKSIQDYIIPTIYPSPPLWLYTGNLLMARLAIIKAIGEQ
jgi:hypothetical protein